jgi:hypothetical protein
MRGFVKAVPAKSRRVIGKVEWDPGELCPHCGFIGQNMVLRREIRTAAYPARHKLWRAAFCFWPSQIFAASSAEL